MVRLVRRVLSCWRSRVITLRCAFRRRSKVVHSIRYLSSKMVRVRGASDFACSIQSRVTCRTTMRYICKRKSYSSYTAFGCVRNASSFSIPFECRNTERYFLERAGALCARQTSGAHSIGLLVRIDGKEHWLEQTVPEKLGTIARIKPPDDNSDCVATSWTFRSIAHTILVEISTDCKKSPSAGHDRPPPKPK